MACCCLFLIAVPIVAFILFKLYMKFSLVKYTVKKDLSGRTALITGATSGIGKATARELARHGCTVLIASRDKVKMADVVEELRTETNNKNIFFYHLDLSSLESIRRCADEIIASGKPIHILINNAGMTSSSVGKTITDDGMERTLQVNHFGPFLFTNLLLDRIITSAPSRIVNVSSMASTWCRYFDFEDVKLDKTPYGSRAAYALSKLENILFTRELARRMYGKNVTVNCLHPGLVATDIFRNFRWWLTALITTFAKTSEEGSRTSLYLAVDDAVEHISGVYFDNCKPRIPPIAALDDANAQKLWSCSETVTGLKK